VKTINLDKIYPDCPTCGSCAWWEDDEVLRCAQCGTEFRIASSDFVWCLGKKEFVGIRGDLRENFGVQL
jgi:hypothetical protein